MTHPPWRLLRRCDARWRCLKTKKYGGNYTKPACAEILSWQDSAGEQVQLYEQALAAPT
jgi:hypothetical protein